MSSADVNLFQKCGSGGKLLCWVLFWFFFDRKSYKNDLKSENIPCSEKSFKLILLGHMITRKKVFYFFMDPMKKQNKIQCCK